jgi:hypothetical protein
MYLSGDDGLCFSGDGGFEGACWSGRSAFRMLENVFEGSVSPEPKKSSVRGRKRAVASLSPRRCGKELKPLDALLDCVLERLGGYWLE